MSRAFCESGWEKQRRIAALLEENHRLKAQWCYRQRQATEGLFGSSTPSAQRPVKAKSPPDPQGQPGHGRHAFDATPVARGVDVPVDPRCPACGGALEDKGRRPRSVLDIAPPRPAPRLYRLERGVLPALPPGGAGPPAGGAPPGALRQ